MKRVVLAFAGLLLVLTAIGPVPASATPAATADSSPGARPRSEQAIVASAGPPVTGLRYSSSASPSDMASRRWRAG